MSQHLQLAVLVSENQPPFQEGWGTHHPEPRDLLSPSACVLHSPRGYQHRGYPQAPQGLRDRGPAQPPPPAPAPPPNLQRLHSEVPFLSPASYHWPRNPLHSSKPGLNLLSSKEVFPIPASGILLSRHCVPLLDADRTGQRSWIMGAWGRACEIQIPRPPYRAMVWGQGQERARLARAGGRTGGVWASPVIAGAPDSPPHTPPRDSGYPEGKGLSSRSGDTAPASARSHLTQTRRKDKGKENHGSSLPFPLCPPGEEPGSPGTRGHIQAWPGKPPPTRHLSRLSSSQGHPQGTRAQTTPVDEVAGVGLLTQGCPDTSCPSSAGLQAAPPSQLHSFTIS